ncbi:hypothetical protein R0G64_31770, partial [Pseudomonas otitidis]
TRSKTNLMVFLRPYIVRDAATGQGITLNRYDYIRRAHHRRRTAGVGVGPCQGLFQLGVADRLQPRPGEPP